jgi:hypothetical protein
LALYLRDTKLHIGQLNGIRPAIEAQPPQRDDAGLSRKFTNILSKNIRHEKKLVYVIPEFGEKAASNVDISRKHDIKKSLSTLIKLIQAISAKGDRLYKQ